MYKGKSILAIITARGGSKGLPGKNIKVLHGKPLIVWTIEQSKKCLLLDEIFVSTDSSEIAQISEQVGVKVPQLRPAELAKDETSSMDVVKYVVDSLESKGKYFDYILLLEPTSPLRQDTDLENVIKKAIDNPFADGVVTLGEVHMEHPMIVKKITLDKKIVPYIEDAQKITRRQQTDKAFFPYGVAYLIKTIVFKEKHAFYTDNIMPYFIERWQNYEIDDIYDFTCVEAVMKERGKN